MRVGYPTVPLAQRTDEAIGSGALAPLLF